MEQVGIVETEIPGIIDTAAAAPVLSKLEAAPPILRPELSTDKKVLTVAEPIAKLNNFQLCATTGGAMFPTTTIITKDRTYVPVPSELEPAFLIAEGAKEFYVRFDTIP